MASHVIEESSQIRQETSQRVTQISGTDISLVELENDVEFVNKPLENASGISSFLAILVLKMRSYERIEAQQS